MPLVFVHGVATRPSKEYRAEVEQRDALFRNLVFQSQDVAIYNPDWGSFAVSFDAKLPWLPSSGGNQAFDGGGAALPSLEGRLALGTLAITDGEQAVDLVAMAALDEAIMTAARNEAPSYAANDDVIGLAGAAGDYLEDNGTLASETPLAIPALRARDNLGFTQALAAELPTGTSGEQAFGFTDMIGGAISHLGGMIGNGLSDAALRAKRRDLSKAVSLFLGDIFVYLRERDNEGADGTGARIFKPITDALADAAKAPRADGEPLVVVCHSLGGVILYDILTDAGARASLEQAIGRPLVIDALFTVGSQPGFFADLGLYRPGRPTGGAKLPMPQGVGSWMNVFDFTDVFSFLCAPMFDGVSDFGYDTSVDLFRAHSAYFQRPSFYKRMRRRLEATGHL